MSDLVSVDVDSAAIAYRPAVGEERCVPALKASPTSLFRAKPWRTFSWYYGQRHYSGTYWASTERDHVIYESRLELANLILADFDAAVHHIVAQPFKLIVEIDGHQHWHVPDYLFESQLGPVVVDVVRAERMDHPRIVRLCGWTKVVVESLGWSYKVVNEPGVVRMVNVRFLAGYRREWLVDQDILSELRCRREELVGHPIVRAEAVLVGRSRPLARAALLGMLWRHEFHADLDRRLDGTTVLEPGL
ncbi:TnsA-like heteromeric transposase endonuclease subunit [Mycobacterium sp. BMJ-28]